MARCSSVAVDRPEAALRTALRGRFQVHAEALAQAARLTDARLASPGPIHPPAWRRPRLADVVAALVQHCEGHMAGAA